MKFTLTVFVARHRWPRLGLAAQQTGVITGTVTNAQTGAPVQNAAVSVESPTFSRQVTTDSAGKYRVPDVPPGTYHVVIRLNQFLPDRIGHHGQGRENRRQTFSSCPSCTSAK